MGLYRARNSPNNISAMLLSPVLSRLIRIGRLGVVDAGGTEHVFEGAPGPSVTVRLHDPALHRKPLLRPRLFVQVGNHPTYRSVAAFLQQCFMWYRSCRGDS